MNSTFLVEVFSSPTFTEDYRVVINNLDDFMIADNIQKIEKFLIHIEKCVEKGNYKVKLPGPPFSF